MNSSLNKDRVKMLLKEKNFKTIFIEELGWDRAGMDGIPVDIDDQKFNLTQIAQKRGMVLYQCVEDSSSSFPDYPTRQKIEKKISKVVREHIIVYVHSDGTQYWQWVKREPGSPDRTRQHILQKGQSGEALIQVLGQVMFTLEEEDKLSILDVAGRVKAAFDVDKVTKRFFDQFKKEHKAFLDSIEGIERKSDKEWYASLMLNRIMFIYFVQKQKFLDNDVDYLRNRLDALVRNSDGNSSDSPTYYRSFLLRLFHEGLGQPEQQRATDLASVLGTVPYFNGGLFDVHELEEGADLVHIPDDAFHRLFQFLDRYQWHLDDRRARTDHEINPDVLGYIFEKYINQKELGAYYTKEDITGYISRNTIIPYLFDAVQSTYRFDFEKSDEIRKLLTDDPDRYIFNSIRHGITYDVHENKGLEQRRDLPPKLGAGSLDLIEQYLNDKAPPEFGLPNESWRECMARRRRYDDTFAELRNGTIDSVNKCITENLDVESLLQDVISQTEDPDLVYAFWKAITNVSVLDPTCGSGAFLFAALNVLEPLYFTCIVAMEGFLDDTKHRKYPSAPEVFTEFRAVLDRMSKHTNQQYFVLKELIINNLYGVDIVKEAVEICKLRLFLKLVAQLNSVKDIEPLPDIDFNIRSGNSVVGFASRDHLAKVLNRDVIRKQDLNGLLARVQETDSFYKKFREYQTKFGSDSTEVLKAKRSLSDSLSSLRTDLDQYLAAEYSIEIDDHDEEKSWREAHQPFHWFIEFHQVMRSGGFGVIIGNPPYIATNKVRKVYNVIDFECSECPDIYAWLLERTHSLLRPRGRTGMIVPLSITFSKFFDVCRRFLFDGYSVNWFSSYGRIPSGLFPPHVAVRPTIHLGLKSRMLHKGTNYTTRLHRWESIARPYLFPQIQFSNIDPKIWDNRLPKLNCAILSKAFENLLQSDHTRLGMQTSKSSTRYSLKFKITAYNWLTFCKRLPPCYDQHGNSIPQTEIGQIYFSDPETRDLAMMLACGKLMLAYWFVVGDDFHVTKWNFETFPIDFRKIPWKYRKPLLDAIVDLEVAMENNVEFKPHVNKRMGNYNLAKCRHITDRSDRIFMEFLGISEAWEALQLFYTQTVRTDFSIS